MPAMIDFDAPALLALLPLALLPLLVGRRDAIPIGTIAWLPDDPVGRWVERLWRALAALAIASLVVGLAGPGRAGTSVERIGRGAEISVLLDRSSSMDAGVRRMALEPGKSAGDGRSKNQIVREALSALLRARPDNRYALTMFNVAPMRVAPFVDDAELVRAGLDASGIGRGPSETDMGRALLAAIDAFEGRAYSGSRVILLVSDGGARLDEAVREEVRRGLARNRIALHFVYVASDDNSPNLERVGTDVDTSREEIALHVFFEGLGTEYHVHQAEDPASMAAAMAEIDSRQNQPLTTVERLPRVPLSWLCFALALAAALGLLALAAVRRELVGGDGSEGRASGRARGQGSDMARGST